MKKGKRWTWLIGQLYLLVPLLLVFFLLGVKVGRDSIWPPYEMSFKVQWTQIRNVLVALYGTLGVLPIFAAWLQPTPAKGHVRFLVVRWCIGTIAVLFSYVLAGLLVDIFWLFFYIYIQLTGQENLLQ